MEDWSANDLDSLIFNEAFNLDDLFLSTESSVLSDPPLSSTPEVFAPSPPSSCGSSRSSNTTRLNSVVRSLIKLQKDYISAHNEMVDDCKRRTARVTDLVLKKGFFFPFTRVPLAEEIADLEKRYADLYRCQLAAMQRATFEGINRAASSSLSVRTAHQTHFSCIKSRRFNKKTVQILEESFKRDSYPNEDEKIRLARLCSLSSKQVNNWFTNKRNRAKN